MHHVKKTRFPEIFNVPFMLLDVSKRFYWVRIPRLLNALPNDIDPFNQEKFKFLKLLKVFLNNYAEISN